jgi:hypothetical protein
MRTPLRSFRQMRRTALTAIVRLIFWAGPEKTIILVSST